MRIHLHLGVHKTATTFVQERLKESLAELNAAGIGYMPLWKFRGSIGADFMKIAPSQFRLERYLKDFFPVTMPQEMRCLVISDENLLGHCGTFLRTGQLFPRAFARLRHFRRLLATDDVQMFCAIRSYDTFIPSAYCEGLRTTQTYVNFRDFMSRVDLSKIRWFELIAGLEKALDAQSVSLWRFEDFLQKRDGILDTLTLGHRLLPSKDLALPKSNSSYSQIAIEAIDAVAARIGSDLAGQIIRCVGDTYPKTDGHRSFQPFDESEKDRLQSMYLEDCAKIPSKHWRPAFPGPEIYGSNKPRLDPGPYVSVRTSTLLDEPTLLSSSN